MTSVSGIGSAFTFNKSMFSNPEMRPYLEEYYENAYAPMRERVAAMKEDEANGVPPQTVMLPDGQVGTMLSADQMESIIPSFDRWLEMQENFSAFDMAEQSASWMKHIQEGLSRAEKDLDPDQSSKVRTVFSDGDKILGYINQDGGLVTHEGGSALQRIAEQANRLNLSGAARIAYLQERGAAELSRRYDDLQVTNYSGQNIPTQREFMQAWYPHHDVDAAYEDTIRELRASLEERQAWHKQQMQNLDDMRRALIGIMEDAQNAKQTTLLEPNTAAEDFLAFMEMTNEERYIALALSEKGYTQEVFDALPPDEQQKIMDEIREELREKTEDEAKSGAVGEKRET